MCKIFIVMITVEHLQMYQISVLNNPQRVYMLLNKKPKLIKER